MGGCRFGLVSLAESNLLDLIASARHHASSTPRVAWFAQFTGALLDTVRARHLVKQIQFIHSAS